MFPNRPVSAELLMMKPSSKDYTSSLKDRPLTCIREKHSKKSQYSFDYQDKTILDREQESYLKAVKLSDHYAKKHQV